MKNLIDAKEVRNTLEIFIAPGQVVEIRALEAIADSNNYRATWSGYFDNTDDLIRAITTIKVAKGIYFTLQECDTDLLYRAKNKIIRSKSGYNTPDKNIQRYRWLLLDSDIERPVKDISSSDEEHELALAHSQSTRQMLLEQGWPEPVMADSGNGAHLLYRIDLLSSESDLVKRVLSGIASRANTDATTIDTSVCNPSRICKLYGTMACKGDNTTERPYRRAHLIQVPDSMEIVSRELLEAIATPIISTPARSTFTPGSTIQEDFTAEAYIKKFNIKVKSQGPYEGGTRYKLVACVWDSSHTDNSACIYQFSDGRLGASCSHNSCNGKGWKELRLHFEPGAYDRQLYETDKPGKPKVQTAEPVKELVKERGKTQAKNPKPEIFRLCDIQKQEFPELKWAIPEILPEGLSWLCGKPKLGKSWMLLNMMLAVACGGVALGSVPVEEGAVLYLALEDNKRRLKSRSNKIMQQLEASPNFYCTTQWPRLNEGGLTYLEEWIIEHPSVRLIGIDTWAKFKPKAQGGNKQQYDEDYDSLTPLQELAGKYGISIVIVHHMRKDKKEDEDPIDCINGSSALAGAVDGFLLLYRKRSEDDARLFITGREIEESQELIITFERENATWKIKCDSDDYGGSPERQRILEVLRPHEEGLTNKQLAKLLDKNESTTRNHLVILRREGLVTLRNNKYFKTSNLSEDKEVASLTSVTSQDINSEEAFFPSEDKEVASNTSNTSTEVKTLSNLFIKKYRTREEPLFWTLPQSGIPNGFVPTRQWYENFKHAYAHQNMVVRLEAIEQLRNKVNI